MKNGLIKGLKPQFIKHLALLMSLCYLLNPLQNQINTILHGISHGLEAPSSLLSHKVGSKTSSEVHENHSHDDRNIEHEHPIVDLIDSIFEASNQNDDSDHSQLIEIKWDKHINTFHFTSIIKFEIKIVKGYFPLTEKLKKGYSKRLEEPPQNSIS